MLKNNHKKKIGFGVKGYGVNGALIDKLVSPVDTLDESKTWLCGESNLCLVQRSKLVGCLCVFLFIEFQSLSTTHFVAKITIIEITMYARLPGILSSITEIINFLIMYYLRWVDAIIVDK